MTEPTDRSCQTARAIFQFDKTYEFVWNAQLCKEIAVALDTVHEESRREAMRENAWLRRLLQWCKIRLEKPEYVSTLDKYLAAGVTEPDELTIVQNAEVERRAAETDAAAYRWLKETDYRVGIDAATAAVQYVWTDDCGPRCVTAQEFDALIDAEIAREREIKSRLRPWVKNVWTDKDEKSRKANADDRG